MASEERCDDRRRADESLRVVVVCARTPRTRGARIGGRGPPGVLLRR